MQENSIPSFPRGVRLQHDVLRKQWLIQAPERAFVLDDTAQEVLKLIDGTRTIASIIDTLSIQYQAPRATIATDVIELITEMQSLQIIKL